MFKPPTRHRTSPVQTKTTAHVGPTMGMSNNLLQLQQSIGNQAVMQSVDLTSGKPINRKNLKERSTTEEKRAKRQNAQKAVRKKAKDETLDVKRGKYTPGMHGFKKSEQKRLSAEYGISVTGTTHESEHTIGFEPLNQTSGLKRGENARAKSLENHAPAYQEMKELHRDHIGTGSQNTPDTSGFNSEGYRNSQRSLVESGDVSSAVQLNQLGYAFDSNKSKLMSTQEGKAATDSYNKMVTNMDSVTYAQGDGEKSVGVDAKQKTEMYLARQAAITGKFPMVEEENAARTKFGVPLIKQGAEGNA